MADQVQDCMAGVKVGRIQLWSHMAGDAL